uniref:Uncharacterized protein n=1 Tax=Anguilla anguilla TaxID=7936 RepID=A0A0E9RZ34_ANGAN
MPVVVFHLLAYSDSHVLPVKRYLSSQLPLILNAERLTKPCV